jgi:tetratricopeptide (TPR) repeat protein
LGYYNTLYLGATRYYFIMLLYRLLKWIKNKGHIFQDLALDSKNITLDTLLLHCEDLIACGSYDAAIRCFLRVIEINPTNSYAWGGKALALYNLKRYEEALTCYNKAIECNPKDPITWHNRGLTLIRLGRLNDAIASFDEAIKLKPDYAKAYFNKGRVLASLGKIDEAQVCLDTARRLDPMLFTKLQLRW